VVVSDDTLLKLKQLNIIHDFKSSISLTNTDIQVCLPYFQKADLDSLERYDSMKNFVTTSLL